MMLSTLSEWLERINSIHINEIDLGVERIKTVARRLDLLAFSCPVIVVGGTNGKGSTVAGLEAIYRANHYHVGAFTSPTLFKHNEQVRIDGELARDQDFCEAFKAIDAARKEVSLTPFEFHTLAALYIFKHTLEQKNKTLDVLILEVGLGGRLDAVNIIDADIAIVTSIALDHEAWLGETREAIAREKAGIFRAERPAVCGDKDPPQSLIDAASAIKTNLFCEGQHFTYQEYNYHWTWSCKTLNQTYDDLPLNSLATQNMATALMTITLLQKRLTVNALAIKKGLKNLSLPGRIQIINDPIIKIFDVAHNPHAILHLANKLKTLVHSGKTYAVFSMLADKNIQESVKMIAATIDAWYIAPLQTPRAATQDQLLAAFETLNIREVIPFTSIEEAYNHALAKSKLGDRIIIFGSFHTVKAVMNESLNKL